MSEIIHPLATMNNQRGRDYTRQRQYGTGDILLDNRIILLGYTGLQGGHTVIDDTVAAGTIQSLLYLQYENRSQEIHMYINSPGGSVTSMLAIYDTMQFLECPVVTYCVGVAASAAAILLASGAPKRRYALPHAKIMIHQPWTGGMFGQASDVEIEMKEILKARDTLNAILSKHTGKPAAAIEAETERNRYFSAEEAREFGLVDEVLAKMAQPAKS